MWCWALWHEGRSLDKAAAKLDLRDGWPATLYDEDPLEEWEVDAVLGHVAEPGFDDMWTALPDWNGFRRVRG